MGREEESRGLLSRSLPGLLSLSCSEEAPVPGAPLLLSLTLWKLTLLDTPLGPDWQPGQ